MAEMFAFDAHESVSQDENPVQSALCVMENLIEDGDKDFLLSLIAEKLDGEKQRTLLSALQSEAAGVLADSSPLGKSDSQPKTQEPVIRVADIKARCDELDRSPYYRVKATTTLSQ